MSSSEDNTGTIAVPEEQQFPIASLSSWLSLNVPQIGELREIRQFRGGQSNPTYLLSSDGGKFVLRRKPPGKLLQSAHDVEREYRILGALHPLKYPVPEPLSYCDDETVVGTSFYIMPMIDGEIYWDDRLIDLEPSEREAIYGSMIGALAQLHSLDWQRSGFPGSTKQTGYIARQIDRWSQQYVATVKTPIHEMEALMDWLPNSIPESESSSIVHGDYRMDNIIFKKGTHEVLAVLDWELSTIGDPLADFTYHLMSWVLPRDAAGRPSLAQPGDFDGRGIPAMQSYVDEYCRLTNRASISNLDFYLAYNAFRLAAICQGVSARARAGNAANESAEAIGSRVSPLAALGLKYARKVASAH